MILYMQESSGTTQTDSKQINPSLQPVNGNSDTQPAIQPIVQAEEIDEDLVKEGYLPEIYFSLKRDNPADW